MSTGFDVQGFRFGDYGNLGPQTVAGHPQEWFGGADINEATRQGASSFQLVQLLNRALAESRGQQDAGWKGNQPGSTDHRFAIGVGQAARNRIAPIDTPYGWTFEHHGGFGFDMGDIADIDTLGQKKELRDFANVHGLEIGAGVDDHIRGLEVEARDLRIQADADARDERHRLHQQGLADQQAARDAERLKQESEFQAQLLAQQEAAAAKASRVSGSSPTGVGGAASIKGSRLNITEAGGRKGTKRFARPTQFMNTLGITSGGTGSAGKSPITL